MLREACGNARFPASVSLSGLIISTIYLYSAGPIDASEGSVHHLNEKDLQLVKAITTEIEVDGTAAIYVLSAKYTNLVRVNLVLLKSLLDEKRKKGVIITIDRPHQYISHLLQLHGIDQTHLTFIDAISTHSADTKAGSVAAEFQKGPFQIEGLPEFLFSPSALKLDPMVDMSQVEFIVIDNVSTLLTYNTMEAIRKFLSKYSELASGLKPKPPSTAFVMDKDLHTELFGIISGMSRKVIDVGADMSIKQVGGAGSPPSMVPPPAQPMSVDLQHSDLGILGRRV